MNDTSGTGKTNSVEKNDRVTVSKKSNNNSDRDNARPNLSDSGTSLTEKASASENKVKAFDRRNSPKTMTKNPNQRQGRDRPRRDDDRRQGGSGRPGRRTDSSYNRGGSAVSGGGRGNFSTSPSPQPGSRENGQSDKKTQDSGRGYHEENKLTKLMRRVFSAGDRERRVSAARALKDFMQTPEGTKACSKGTTDLLSHLQGIFYERGYKEVKQEIAGCIGYIGSLMGQDIQGYFDWLFSHACSAMVDDDVKICFLQALLETLKHDEKRQNTPSMMSEVMSNIQALLEGANSDLMVAVVDVTMFIAKFYPHIFSPHFNNTVDILVGWHIDLSQKESLIQYVSSALVSFRPFWSADINFSSNLLMQFLEDLEAYAEDLTTSASDQSFGSDKLPSPEEFTIKMGALLRVFTTVLDSLGDNLVPANNKISKSFSCRMLDKVVVSMETALRYVYIESVVVAANNCISVLLTHLGAEALSCADTLLPYISLQAFYSRLCSRQFLLAFFNLVHKVVVAFGIQLPVDFLSHLFESDSLLFTARLSHHQEVLSHLMTVYHAVMGLKSVPLLEESYRLVLADMEIGMKALLPPEHRDFSLVQDNPFSSVTYSVRQAVTIILFNLNALAEIANSKSNLIGMWALSPSIFDLLCDHLEPTDHWLAERHPCVQYAILHTLYGHCCRHGNFVSSSSLLSSSDTVSMANLSQANSEHLTRILRLLLLLFEETRTSFDVRCLALKWVHDIVHGLLTTSHVFVMAPFLSVVRAVIAQGYDREVQVMTAASYCLITLFKSGAPFSISTTQECMELCSYRLTDTRKPVKELFFTLLKMLPLDVTTSSSMGFEGEEEALARQRKDRSVGLKMAWLARRNHMGFPSLGLFHSHNFRHVISYMLNNTPPSQFGGLHWLQAMFYNGQRSHKEAERGQDNILLSDMDATDSLLWFWATYESAHFTVLSRLRTPLGKPQDTFMSIESVLKAFATEARNATDSEEASVGVDSNKGEKAGEYGCLQRVHTLLQYMEHLERILYNAYEGCAVAMAAPPKIVKTFFRTNRSTCLEWLSRIRMCIMTVAAHAGLPAVVVRHAHELLRDLLEMDRTQESEFEQGVVYLVRALCDLNCPEAVQGVYSWCRLNAGKKFAWVKAATERASRKYEQAAKEYQSVLKNMLCIEDGSETKESSESADSSPEHRQLNKKISVENSSKQSSSSSLSKQNQPLPTTVSFITNEVVEMYLKLSDWNSVLQWQEQLNTWRSDTGLTHLQSSFHCSVDINYIKAMASFEVGDLEAVRSSLELVPGGSLSEGNKAEHSNLHQWSPRTELAHMQRQFLRAATLLEEQRQTNHRAEVIRFLNQAEKSGEGLLRLAAIEWPPLLSGELLTETAVVGTLRKQLEDRKGKTYLLPLSSRLRALEDQDVTNYLQMLKLISVQLNLQACDKRSELLSHQSNLQITAATLARKQTNFQLAENLLTHQTLCLLSQPEEDGRAGQGDLPSLISSLKGCDSLETLEVMRVERESAKLLYALNQPRKALDILSSSVAACLTSGKSTLNGVVKPSRASCGELCSRSLMTLTKWLQADSKLLGNVGSEAVRLSSQDSGLVDSTVANVRLLLDSEASSVAQQRCRLLASFPESVGLTETGSVAEGERVVGRLLHLATMESPGLAKAWFLLAGWCYKWGRKTVDTASRGSVELSAEEKAAVTSILPPRTRPEDMERVMEILSQVHDLDTTEEDISDQDQSLYDDGTETTRRQLLLGCEALQLAGDQCVEQLLDVWKGVVKRVYHLYQLSASAYFIFLQLNDQSKEEENEDGNIIATLRLLRLLVKHAWELQTVLETGLADTPTAPWKGIIPQLFARLSHPENYVRRSVSELLCRVAQDAPHLIVYPAIVGSTSGKVYNKVTEESKILSNYLSEEEMEGEGEGMDGEEDDEDDDNGDDSTTSMLQSCLASVVDTLSQHNPRMISEVEGMVMELRRVTLLWEELWLGTLTQHHSDVQRHLNQLETEIRKVNLNQGLNRQEKTAIIREKHRTILKPTVYTMERLHEITSQAPETPHEAWFQATYGEMIQNALDRLKNPSNPSHPHASWHLFKQVYISLQQRASKRGSLQLKIDEISPRLAALSKSLIPMPGIGLPGQMVTIQKVCNTVQILPTKTKPKKMVFIGSDGKRHPYLFKGLEDLHLDERIMQFLSIVNNMFVSASRGQGKRMEYRARHYSVTPLGPRSGLIQWVEGATPLFSLYKKWQQREAYAQTLKPGASANTSGNTNTAAPVPRPSEIYYSKLNPALKEKGMEATDHNRKEWPLSTLRKVLEDLMDDTPEDLLAKELWCASGGAGEWWQMVQTYSRSTAVMSMIGYIIGLGDRHLDNVLVDLATGEVVHIDYNVCFEKGKNLRVPERVPFRMTQNIEAALGVTGIEGIFRLSSEHVLRTMRKGRETLLTLLEAFVYDPLVDWTTGNEGGYTGAFYGGEMVSVGGGGDAGKSKKEMEREITLSMFAIRCAEMSYAWNKNKEEILGSVPELQKSVEHWVCAVDELDSGQQALDSLHQLRAVLVEAAADPSHALFSLSDRYCDYSLLQETREEVMKAVEEKMAEFSHWHQLHKAAVESVQGTSLQTLLAEVSKPHDMGPASFTAAIDFLQGAGQSKHVTQCEQLEGELSSLLKQRRTLLSSTVEVLRSYSAIVSQFGTAFANNNRAFQFLGYLQELISNFSSTKCEEITSRFQEAYGPQVSQTSRSQLVLVTESRLESIITDTNAKLIKLLERGGREDLSSSVSSLEMALHEAEAPIHTFLLESGPAGERSLIGFVVSALSSLSKRYLLMESASSAAGERLMDLTSRDGDWFLEELSSISGNVNHFLNTLERNTTVSSIDQFRELHAALCATYTVYVAIQDLHMNFRSIILPEALKLMQSQEPSILSALSQLESLVGESAQPLESLVAQLEVMHRNVIMGIQGSNKDVLNKVQQMQTAFNQLLQGLHQPSQDMAQEGGHSDLSPGQMLLMGFDGLFTRLDSEFNQLLSCVSTIHIPDAWGKVDAVREARALQLSPWSSDTRSLLSLLFFLKRLQAMQEFFHMVTQLAAALQGLNGGAVYDDEQMAKPIKKFIAEFVRKQMIGFPSQLLGCMMCVLVETLGLSVESEVALKDVGALAKVPLEDMCKKAVENNLRAGHFLHPHLTQATTLTSAQDLAWRKLDLGKRMEVGVSLLKGSCQRWQGLLTCFQWQHEDIVTGGGQRNNSSSASLQSRPALMAHIKKMLSSLSAQEGQITSCQERYVNLEGHVTQRLRWAAGANPSLNTTMQNFQDASTARASLMEEESRLVSEVVNICQGVLHFEAWRTRTQEAVSIDTAFMSLINRCYESSLMLESTSTSVTPQELQLLTIKPLQLGERVTVVWLQAVTEQISVSVSEAGNSLHAQHVEITSCKSKILEGVADLRSLLSTHHKLMSDIRSILKTMAKLEEQDYGEEINPDGIRHYLSSYKMFSENITTALKSVVSEEATQASMFTTQTVLQDLVVQIPGIYDGLMQFAPPLLQPEREEDSPRHEVTRVMKRGEEGSGSPAHRLLMLKEGSSSVVGSPQHRDRASAKRDKVSRDPRTGKAVQERNSYAVGVWRRVKMKLDGRDPDSSKRLSVPEQVDYVIKEARDLDNLAVLYEGWTPWV
ncbi:serine/threonine-protein kinase SMG1-like [Babylonia areolata]|uniref:serine/threonine-protein kinase SMG1-like n=1 Tax=Babylonia areolata TaxID=304850 RepID=UPI003FD5EBCB